MKTKLQIQTSAAILILFVSLASLPAQPATPRGPAIDPLTGLPARAGAPLLNPATGLPADRERERIERERLRYSAGQPPLPPAVPVPIDPTTGLPTTQPAPQWIDPNWPDPVLVLTNVVYDNLPLSEVARDLREHFKNDFDILPMPGTYGKDWGASITIQLQLKHVKASDVFNAMNLIFENDQTPLRWELKATGNRPMVLLRVLPEAAPQAEPPPAFDPTTGLPIAPAPETRRMVYFVGNLLGDEKSGGMTMEQLIKTVLEIWPKELGDQPESILQFHKEAQLLVVNGTRDQLEFIHQTLAALELKAQQERAKHISADLKSRMDGSKNNDATK